MTVLDASAVLAVVKGEAGSELVAEAIGDGRAIQSTVTFAEVATWLARHAAGRFTEVVDLLLGQVEVVPFDVAQAETTGQLVVHTASRGLSLGDRACLALAFHRGEPVLTADRAWETLPSLIGVEVRLVR